MFWVPCVHTYIASQRGRSMKDDDDVDDDAGSLSMMSVKTTLTLVTVVGPGCWTCLVWWTSVRRIRALDDDSGNGRRN